MALTILQYWQDQSTLYQQAETVAQSDLTAAQQMLKTANETLAVDLQALDKVDKRISENRARLSATTIPADANALVATIAAAIIEQRNLQGTVLDDRDQVDEAQASLDSTASRLSRIKARASAIKAGLLRVEADAKRLQDLRFAVTQAPLDTLRSDATNLVTTAATDAVRNNFPDEIFDLAELRYQTRAGRLKSLKDSLQDAQDALGTELEADNGLQGEAGLKRIVFERARDELARYVASAADRYQSVRVLMEWLATSSDILTAAELAELGVPANADPGAAAAGLMDTPATEAQDAIDQAIAAKAAAVQAAAAEKTAEQDLAEAILAAGETAETAARTGVPDDVAAAQDAANDAVTARDNADQAAVDRTTAEATANDRAADARTAIVAAAATPKARAVGICLAAVYAAQTALDAGILGQIDTDVDTLTGDPTALQTERDAVTAALTTYQGALAAFAAAGKTDLDRWEAIIPDPAWKVLLDYREGLAVLEELKNIDAGALVTAMDTAEDAYATALAAAALAERKADALGDAIALREQRLTLARAAITSRLPSAVRGDTY